MKKIVGILVLILILIISINKISKAATPSNQQCLVITGHFYATGNWPANATIDVGCDGDGGSLGCNGGTPKTIRPGQDFVLDKCSCPPYANGCLKVAGKLEMIKDGAVRKPRARATAVFPTQCSLPSSVFILEQPTTTKYTSAANKSRYTTYYQSVPGKCSINGQPANIDIVATCPSTTPTPTFTGTPTPSKTNTPTPTNICTALSPVTGVHISCPNCSQASSGDNQ